MDTSTLTVSLGRGEVLLKRLLQDGVALAHDCDGTLACASCCVIVRAGAQTLDPASEDEIDMLDRANIGDPGARLACQAVGSGGDLVVDIPGSDASVFARTSTAASSSASALPVSITERAARYLAAQLAKRPSATAVRLAVEPAGCSGFGYKVEFAEEVGVGDAPFERSGVRIVVDSLSLPLLRGTCVDLVQEGLARRLRFDNPNARQRCGCGESFRT